MADLASLRIAVDSREVRTARDDLLSLSGGAEKANKSVVSLGSGFNAIKGVIATLGLGVIAADIARANAEFQRLQAALTIATGSAGQASAAFNEIRKFAATTPYELNQSVEAFLRLKNLGLDPSIQSMRSYGNTASAMGKDLMQMVEAVADATTGEFERLKEFGIKASKAGDEVAFTFQGVTTTVKNNADAIQQYLLAIGNTQFAGGMEMQMQTLGGQFSNLKDNLDALYVAIGQAGANNALTQLMTSLSAAIVWATENIDLLTQVIGTAVTAFISYQATTIAIGVAISAYTAYTAAATAGTVAFTAALVANPAGAVAVAVAALAGAIFYLKNRTSELTDTTIVQSAEARNLKDATEALNNVLADGSATDAAIASSRALVGQRLQEAKAAYEAAKAEVARRNALANIPLIGGIMKLSADKAKREMLDLQDAVMNGILNSIGLGKSSVDAMVTHAEKGTAKVYSSGKKVREKSNADAERAAKELAKSIADLNAGVMDGLHITMREMLKTMDALTKGDVVQMMDEINKRSDERVKLANAETKARVKTNEELVKTVDYLDQVFGLDGNLGKLFGALKSGFGDVFDALSGAFGKLRDSIGNFLAKMGSSFAAVQAGAEIGAVVNAGMNAIGIKSSNAGAQIGGAIGSAFGGPLGAIAGSIVGGLIGGMFMKTKQASATISSIGGQAVVSAVKGNDAKFRESANSMANGLIKSLANIAEQLGGQLGGAVSLSIGQRKKDFVVDPTGKGRTKGAGVINFGEDQAAAIAYATQLAIQQGIITGLSAGANTLIKAGGDLQAQLDKALKFDQVFKDLRKETDPLGAALAELSTEFDKLQVIFKEAGASAADYAALEELYAIKRRKATMEAERPRRELEIQLMELSGDAAGALAAQRKLELAAMDESLRGLQMQVYAMQDLRGQLDAADSRLADAEQALAEARRRERERQIEAMRAEIVQLDAIIAKRDEARNALQAAYDAEVARIDQEISKRQDAISAINETINGLKSFANSIREFAGSIVSFSDTGTRSLATLELQFQQVLGLAATGNQAAMGQIVEIGGSLREAIIANATDRPSMLRQLYGLRSQALGAAENVDMQVMDLQTQADREIAMVALLEQQKVDLANMVNQFLQLNTTTLSVDEAIRQLQSAEAAAAAAEVRKVQLEEQIAQLTKLDENLISIEAAQAEYEAAKKARDEIKQQLDQISFTMLNDTLVTGFADVVEATLSLTSSIRSATSSSGSSGASVSSGASSSSGFSGAWYGDPFNGYSYFDNLPYFANGGIHNGGLRVVGENGPELEATGPSRIYNANQLGDMMGGGATAEEVKALREELKLAMYQIAKNTGKNYDLMKRWDGDGLPEQRNYAA